MEALGAPVQHSRGTRDLDLPGSGSAWLSAGHSSDKAQIQGNFACISEGIYSFR